VDVRSRVTDSVVTLKTAQGRTITSTPEHTHFAGHHLGATPQIYLRESDTRAPESDPEPDRVFASVFDLKGGERLLGDRNLSIDHSHYRPDRGTRVAGVW